MKKRFLTALMAVCLVFALGTVGALADGLPEPDGENVIKLQENVTDTLVVGDGENITLDLNGFTLTNTEGQHTITVESGGTLTVIDSSAGHSGVVDNVSHARAAVYNKGGTVYLSGGTFTRSHENGITSTDNGGNSYYVILNHGIMTISNGVTVTQDGNYSSMIENGYQSYNNRDGIDNPTMTVNGGVFSGGLNTFKNDDGGYLTVNGGDISNVSQAALLNWNVTTINNGTFTVNSTASSVILNGYLSASSQQDQGSLTITNGTFNGNGVEALERMGGSNSMGNITISGGKFNGDIAIPQTYSAINTTVSISNAKITGNVTNGNSKNVLLVEDAEITGNVQGVGTTTVVDSTINGETTDSIVLVNSYVNGVLTNTAPDNVVAIIGGQQFSSLQDAVTAAAAMDGQTTITLLGDTTGAGVVVPSGSDIIIDLGGHTYSVDEPVGSSGTETNGFQLLRDSNITIKNGTIQAAEDARVLILIQNYSNLTTENLVLDGRTMSNGSGTEYTLSNNNGEITLNSGTVIYARSDADKAMDVCWAAYYTAGARVTVNDGVVINGDVELGLWGQTAYEGNQSVLTVNGGTINGELGIMVSGSVYGSTAEAIEAVKSNVAINGGTFGNSVDAYIDSDTEASAKVSYNGTYTYYDSLDDAMDNAPMGSTITYLGSTTGVQTYTVTFVYYNGYQTAMTVPAGTEITLPGATRANYTFDGWKYTGGTLSANTRFQVNGNVTFTAVWKDGQYDIVIDDGMKFGDVIASVSSADLNDTVTLYVRPDLGFKLDEIKVTYKSGLTTKTVALTYVLENTYTFKMPAADVLVTATFKADGMPFVDVSRNQWFYDAVYYVWSNGVMEGVSTYYFYPGDTMTRAMFWTVLARIDGESITGPNWVSEARAWAMANGVSDGTDPYGKVTREQMVTMLWRYIGEPNGTASLSGYTDAGTVSGWAEEAMRWAIGRGVINGMTNTTLEPRGDATRAQCATIFMRYMKLA